MVLFYVFLKFNTKKMRKSKNEINKKRRYKKKNLEMR